MGLAELKGKVMLWLSADSVTPLEFAEMPVEPRLKLTLVVFPQPPEQCQVKGNVPVQLANGFQRAIDPLPDPDTRAVNPLVDRFTFSDMDSDPLNCTS